MVSPQNPLKQKSELMPNNIRYKWATMALENTPDIKASDFEFSLSLPSFTYNTLTKLKEKHTDCEFYLIIGADNWAIFDKWFKAKEIINNFKIIIYPRNGYTINKEDIKNKNITYVEAPLYNVSSTEIRQKIANNENIENLLPHNITKDVELQFKKYFSKKQI